MDAALVWLWLVGVRRTEADTRSGTTNGRAKATEGLVGRGGFTGGLEGFGEEDERGKIH